MSKATKDYQKIIDDLDRFKCHCEEMARCDSINTTSWKEDVCALQESMDIISDYEKVIENSNRMMQHYETKAKPVRRDGVWCCPECGKRTSYNHSHCHWCGKKLGWEQER